MKAPVDILTPLLLAEARRQGAVADSAAAALEAASAVLRNVGSNPQATPEQWQSALADWRAAVAAVAGAAATRPPTGLMLDAIAFRLPPLPGISDIVGRVPRGAPLEALAPWRDGLRPAARLGPLQLRAVIPAIIAGSAVDPVGQVLGLAPPAGLGVELDAGVVRGGGALAFAETPHWRLSGAFGVSVGPVSASALGILERPGGILSLLVLLSARFLPGLQLGFGFAISGVGGLVAINRRADSDMLRAKLASGAASAALFPDDLDNAPAILDTLGALFVPEPGSFVAGPTLQLSWLKLGGIDFMLLDVAVLIELPGPRRILVIGRAMADIAPDGLELLHLQLDIAGELDFARSVVNLRAGLVDSHALGVFRASGDAALILSWGEPAYQLLTCGGFYPGFNPAPAVVAPLRRMALSMGGWSSPAFSAHFEAYLAATTNSFQLGGRLDVRIGVGMTAAGHISLDAIFQFQPFHFEADISGSLRVGVLGKTFAGVDVHGHLSGPGPLVLRARISIDLWLTDFSWSHTFRLGGSAQDQTGAIELVPALAAELQSSNLHATEAADRSVALAPAPERGGRALLSPLGGLSFTQRSAPLGLRLERFGARRLSVPTTAVIEPLDPDVAAGRSRTDLFAPGTFLDLTPAELLNQPPYDRLECGFELNFVAAQAATPVEKQVRYREYHRGRPPSMTAMRLFGAGVLASLDRQSAAPSVEDLTPVVTAREEQWVTYVGGSAAPAASRTAAQAAVRSGMAEAALAAADTPISLGQVA